MRKSVYLLFLLFYSVNCLKNDTNNMLMSFITSDDRPTSVLIPNLCWSPYDIRTLARNLSSVGIRVACSLQPKRPEFHLNQILIIADLVCPGVNSFLTKTSDDGFMKSPYRWLLLNEEGADLNILDHLEILIDSDVVVARRQGEDVHFIEVYKLAENKEVIYSIRSIWRPTYHQKYPDVLSKNETDNKNKSRFTIKGENTSSIQITFSKYGVIEDYRNTKVISVRRKDLRRHTLTMVIVITDSNGTRKHLDDRLYLAQDSIAKISYAGVKICLEMMNASEKLMFTHTWGYKDKNGNWQGMIEYLLKKEADLGTLAIFTKDRMQVVDYIAMVGSTRFRFVLRQPPLAYITNIYILPFTGVVWLASFLCVLGCSVFLYVTSKWEATRGTHPLQLDGWLDVFILAIGAVLQQGCTLAPRYSAGRCVFFLLFMSLTILYAAYSANIVVLLRAPSFSMNTLSDLLNSPMRLGASDFEYNRYFFKKLNEPIRKEIYNKKIAPEGQTPNYFNLKDGIEKVRQGMFALHIEVNPGYRLIQETFQENEKCDLVEIDYINEIDPWVPGQKRSPFKDMFKINFMKIRESGIQACNQHRLTIPKPKCSGSISSFTSVGITDMLPALLATLYIVLLAPAVLLLEIAHKLLLSLRKLRKIKRNPLQQRFEFKN